MFTKNTSKVQAPNIVAEELKKALESGNIWRCSCGATNSDIAHSSCQFCGRSR